MRLYQNIPEAARNRGATTRLTSTDLRRETTRWNYRSGRATRFFGAGSDETLRASIASISVS
jgi:hypothetical protein